MSTTTDATEKPGPPRPQALVLDEQQQALQEITRRWVRETLDSVTVRKLMATDAAFDPSHWQAGANIGWPALVVPEETGGAGAGVVELAVVMEELGRGVAPVPLLSTSMATIALLEFGGGAHDGLVATIAAGEARPTLAWHRGGTSDRATLSDDGAQLSGSVSHVIDAPSATGVVVVADGGVVHVPMDRDGVTVESTTALDPTRPLGTVTFDDVVVEPANLLAGDPTVIERRARNVGAMLLANELVGVAAAAHAMAVDHAKTRTQFGRAIGSFQAIKHLLADDLVAIEAARSVAWQAARALAAGDDAEAAVTVPMAASLCPEVAAEVTGHVIQVHGGIGFTWEHDAHLYYKRASAAHHLLGTPRSWRRRLATVLEL